MPPSPDGRSDGARPPRPSGAWRAGADPVGHRRFVTPPGALALERGGSLPSVTVAYETYGRLASDGSNAVLVLHALTGDSHLAGPAGPGHVTAGWWDPLVGPGRPFDTERYFVVCPNVLGGCQGTTGPASTAPDGRPWGSRWPQITIGDQVRVEALLADALGIDRWLSVVGGSMGGMRALEWVAAYPSRVRSAVALACGAVATAEQIALYSTHLDAIRSDPGWDGGDYHDGPGPVGGLALARRIAQVGYRTADELQTRFGNSVQPDGRYAVASYLRHAGDKLVGRFDAGTYVTLTEAMMSQDVGRGRGGVEAALGATGVPVTVGGIDSDRLYPPSLQADLAETLGARLHLVPSLYGHDGFLLETEAIGGLIRSALGAASSAVPARRS